MAEHRTWDILGRLVCSFLLLWVMFSLHHGCLALRLEELEQTWGPCVAVREEYGPNMYYIFFYFIFYAFFTYCK